MDLLLRHPDQLARVCDDTSLVPAAVAEMLRVATPGRYIRRTATADTELAGHAIKRGEAVAMNFTVANYDPDLFPDPLRFDIDRKPNDALAFSFGPHRCIGMSVARLQSTIAFQELLKRYPATVAVGPALFRPSTATAVVESLPVLFQAAACDAVVPSTAQTAADIAWGILALLSLVYALIEWRRTRSPLPVILLIGGAIAYLNEPIVDAMGLVWHPRPNQERVISTLGPLPLWGLFCYVVFFGAGTHLLLKLMRRGLTRRRFWTGVGALMLVNLAIEIPLLPTHLYYYYGYHTPPMTIAHLPVYWLFLNVGGPLLAAAVLLAGESFFTGRRMLAAALIPMTSYAAYSLAAGWPIFSALHAKHLAPVFVWAAALLTITISAVLLDRIAVLVETRKFSDRRLTSNDTSVRALRGPEPKRAPTTA
jgi:hypothetical protein